MEKSFGIENNDNNNEKNMTEKEISLSNELESLKGELKKSQEELITSQEKLEKLKKFIPVMAHDLKSPFNGILGFVNLLNENYADFNEEERVKFIKLISTSSNRYYSFLEELLTWSMSQIEGAKPNIENLSLSQSINKVVEIYSQIASEKNIELINESKDDFTVLADAQMLEAVIRNLVSNALKFTNSEGKVIVSTVPEGENKINILVTDTGVGLSADKKNNILNNIGVSTDGTNKEKGTGLGLNTCVNFTKLMGGEIKVESEEGKGTTFIVTLPAGK